MNTQDTKTENGYSRSRLVTSIEQTIKSESSCRASCVAMAAKAIAMRESTLQNEGNCGDWLRHEINQVVLSVRKIDAPDEDKTKVWNRARDYIKRELKRLGFDIDWNKDKDSGLFDRYDLVAIVTSIPERLSPVVEEPPLEEEGSQTDQQHENGPEQSKINSASDILNVAILAGVEMADILYLIVDIANKDELANYQKLITEAKKKLKSAA